MVSPFDNVPYEIISMIFHEAVKGKYDDSEDMVQTKKSDRRLLLALSRVCRLWRDISLGESDLWGAAIDVDCDDLDCQWFLELAQRAGTKPLVIHSQKSISASMNQLNNTAWKYVLPLVARWRTFALDSLCEDEASPALLTALTTPAPKLEVFRIIHPSEAAWPFIYIYSRDPTVLEKLDHFMLPDNLFGGHAPCLKSFTISNAYLRSSFDFSVWTQLTELVVEQCLGGLNGDKISARKWLTILGEIQQLETLVLAWSYSSNYDEVLDDPLFPENVQHDHSLQSADAVDLKCLRSLGLVATFERNIMFDIFPKLIVPNTCTTSITVAHDYQYELSFNWLKMGLDHHVEQWRKAYKTCGLGWMTGPPAEDPDDLSVEAFGFRIYLPKTLDEDLYNFQFRYIDSDGTSALTDPYIAEMFDALEQVAASFSYPLLVKVEESIELPIDFCILENVF